MPNKIRLYVSWADTIHCRASVKNRLLRGVFTRKEHEALWYLPWLVKSGYLISGTRIRRVVFGETKNLYDHNIFASYGFGATEITLGVDFITHNDKRIDAGCPEYNRLLNKVKRQYETAREKVYVD